MRVLVADDQPRARQSMKAVLDAWRCLDEVREAADGDEAVQLAESFRPDVILMDVMMPSMDGPQTLKHLRERHTTAGLPVVFMTARAQTRELAHFLSLGAAGIIPKQFDPMTLAGEVKRYTQRASDAVRPLVRSG